MWRERVGVEGLVQLARQNKTEGFACVSCAWPKSAKALPFEFCEEGAKATAWELTRYRTTPEFFARHTLTELREWTDYALEQHGDRPDDDADWEDDVEAEIAAGIVDAPPALAGEIESLIRFKTATLTEIGFQRLGVWNEATALQKIEHLGLLFGALAASPRSVVKGPGVPLDALCFGLFVFPPVWDWYVQWRERRRGFYTTWEVNMLQLGMALARRQTGWLRQNPALAGRLTEVDALVSSADIADARADWDGACDRLFAFAHARLKEVERVARSHVFIARLLSRFCQYWRRQIRWRSIAASPRRSCG